MSKIDDLLGEFKEGDAFEGQPVWWVYGQMGHGYLGAAITSWVVFIMGWITGDFPDAAIIAGLVTLAYLFWWEIDVQGWKGWDTIIDTFFVGCGASLFIVIDMSEVIGRLSLWFFATAAVLVIGMLKRL